VKNMKLGLNLAMTNWHQGPDKNVSLAKKAEELGFSSVWCEEAYGTDAVSPLAWVGAQTSRIHLGSAIWQVPARTPAMAAMTAATLDVLSSGRIIIGLGCSGPQVVEGFHGKPFNRPVGRTREYIEICRAILARDKPVSFQGRDYQLPYSGSEGMGIGKPLKLIITPKRKHIPIYVGALGPKNIEMTAEIADGWLPIFFSPRVWEDVFGADLKAGFDLAGQGKGPGSGFDVAPIVSVVVDDDVNAARRVVKERISLYIGGMGHAKLNVSNRLIRRFGYEDVADKVQELFLSGKREESIDAVSDELVDDVALCGPRSRIAELLERWEASPVTTIICDTEDVKAMEVMADLVGTTGEKG